MNEDDMNGPEAEPLADAEATEITAEQAEFEALVAEWKSAYPEVFSTTIEDTLYVWRPLTRDEYRQMIRSGFTEENAQHDLIASKCILWPRGYDDLLSNEPAGYVNMLAKGIMNSSGFLVNMDPLRVDLLTEEDLETLDEDLAKIVPAALMQFPKRLFLSIIGNRQFLWRLLTRQEYRDFKNVQGNADILYMEEKLIRKCVLWPRDSLGVLTKGYAGYVTSLSEQITFQSGFGSEVEVKKL